MSDADRTDEGPSLRELGDALLLTALGGLIFVWLVFLPFVGLLTLCGAFDA